jgi:hypothetical protein
LRAFNLMPFTEHVETVARFERRPVDEVHAELRGTLRSGH